VLECWSVGGLECRSIEFCFSVFRRRPERRPCKLEFCNSWTPATPELLPKSALDADEFDFEDER
jgi:hypothetical protein